jgi:hypothetical protein
MRATTVDEHCLGNLPGLCLKPGDVQHMVFQQNDPPPFQDPTAPPTGVIRTVKGKLKPYYGYIGANKGLLQVLYKRTQCRYSSPLHSMLILLSLAAPTSPTK